jgi:ketosteroid isomerase-like protein
MSKTYRRIVPAVALAIVATTNANGSDKDELIAVDKRMQRAFVDKDVAALDKIFTDDYVLVVSSGEERTKAQILKEVASGDTRWEVNESSGWKVRVHGDVAIVVATLHQKGTDHGKPFDSNVKFSDTYLRDHGTWRNVHAHASRAVDVAKGE